MFIHFAPCIWAVRAMHITWLHFFMFRGFKFKKSVEFPGGCHEKIPGIPCSSTSSWANVGNLTQGVICAGGMMLTGRLLFFLNTQESCESFY
jgi:hypothetical protein